MAEKMNCWQFKKCGREQGGTNVAELGVCPAAVDTTADGLNGGRNGGRICWAISGSFSDRTAEGVLGGGTRMCLLCDFYKMVKASEGYVDFKVLKPEQIYHHTH
ncbi:MAG: two-CW domain-containing protein [bacterium]